MRVALSVLLISLLLIPATLCTAQRPAKAFARQTTTFLQKMMDSLPQLPGVIMVVVKDDKPVFMQAMGWADREQHIKADQNTLYYLASATKSYTAMAAALLHHQGKINLDDPIEKYVPDVIFRHRVPASHITIRQLLTHTSGLTNDALTFRMAYSGDIEPESITAVFRDETTWADSSYRKYNYDNLGYNILTVLLQKHLGLEWQDLVQQQLFDPLGMKHTSARISKASTNNWQVAVPYLAYGEAFGTQGPIRSWLPKKDNNLQSAGGIYTSLNDLATWLRININQGKLNGQQLIPEAVIRECHTGYASTPQGSAPFTEAGEYGLGWHIGQYKQEKVIYHFGGFPGFRSHVSFMPGKKLGLAIVINDGNIGGRATNLLATYAYDWWLQQGAGIEQDYQNKLQQLVTSFHSSRKAYAEDWRRRAQRTWQLSKPLSHYVGQYENPGYGKMKVYLHDTTLAVKMGYMQAVSSPASAKESIRVELIPGTGQTIEFLVNEQGIITGLVYDKREFVRKLSEPFSKG